MSLYGDGLYTVLKSDYLIGEEYSLYLDSSLSSDYPMLPPYLDGDSILEFESAGFFENSYVFIASQNSSYEILQSASTSSLLTIAMTSSSFGK
jgi:hypothetical protein